MQIFKQILTVSIFIFLGKGMLFSQTAGINYHALILNSEEIRIPGSDVQNNQVPIGLEEVSFRFSITNEASLDLYIEEQTTTTDENGMVSLIVGSGTPSFSTFDALEWNGILKYLNVEIDIHSQNQGYVFLDTQKILYLPQSGTGELADASVTPVKISSGGNDKVLVTDATGAVAWIDKTSLTGGDVQSVFGRAGVVTATSGDYNAGEITNTPAGNIAAITAQTAINELDTEKLSTTLTSTNLLVGNGSNLATGVALSGDATLANTGALTIADDAVDGTDISIASEATGSTLYYDGTDWIQLGVGTAGQMLSVNAGATAPEWTSATAGSLTNLSDVNTATATAGNFLLADGTDFESVALSGDATIAATGALTIADNSVDGTDISIASEAAGDVTYFNGTDWVRLPKGTAGQALVMNTGATAPEWQSGSTTEDLEVTLGAYTSVTNGTTLTLDNGVTWDDVKNDYEKVKFYTVSTSFVRPTLEALTSDLSLVNSAIESSLGTTASIVYDQINSGSGTLRYNPTVVSTATSIKVVGVRAQSTVIDATDVPVNVAGAAAGAVMYYNGTDWVDLGVGTAGQVLQVNAGATAPEWTSATAGSLTNLSDVNTATATAGNFLLADGTDFESVALSGDATIAATGALTIADNSVDGTDISIASEAAGDVTYFNGTDWVRLAKGTAGQRLVMNTGATAPEWQSGSTTTAPSRISLQLFDDNVIDSGNMSGFSGASNNETNTSTLGDQLGIGSATITYSNGTDITRTLNQFNIITAGVYEVFISFTMNDPFATDNTYTLQMANNGTVIAASATSQDGANGNPANMVIKYVGSFSASDVLRFHMNSNGGGWRGKAISVDIQKID